MSSEDSIERKGGRLSSIDYANKEGFRNITERSESNSGQIQQYENLRNVHFVPSTLKSTLGSPTALAIGAFATTLTTLSLSLMEWRGVTITNVYIGNFFFSKFPFLK
jgi:hypothetical protein